MDLKFKFDENIPKSAKKVIDELGYDEHTVNQEGILGIDDKGLLDKCLKEERILITSDDDFLNPILYKRGTYYGIIYLQFFRRNPNFVSKALL